jgi:hypothetical protein
MSTVDERVTAAVRAGGVTELDARGLMPLERARAILRGVRTFVRGAGRSGPNGWVLDSDVTWSALLSLEDAAELVRVASALRWQFQPRGMENVDLYLRYGEGIVPWIASRIRRGGTLVNDPWCVVPCLLACGSHEAFELVWRLDAVERWRGRRDLRTEWLSRHEELGLAALALHAVRGDERARTWLVAQRIRGKDAAIRQAARVVEERARRGLLVELGIEPGAPTARAILAVLDACADVPGSIRRWPTLAATDPSFACYALRLVAARTEDGWGILFERVTGEPGDAAAPVQITELAVGCAVPRLARITARPLAPAFAALSSAALAERAAKGPDSLFGPPATGRLGLGPAARELVRTTRFAHVERRPSSSPVYRSLADALASGEGERFSPES